MPFNPYGDYGGYSNDSWDTPINYSSPGYSWAGTSMGYSSPQNYFDYLLGNRSRMIREDDEYKQKDRNLQVQMQRSSLEAQWRQLLEQLKQQRYNTDVGYMSNMANLYSK